MKRFKKFLLSVLSLALVAVLSIGGTLAYLKSEDSDVNVMTMGNVKIAQHEYERVINDNGEYEMVTSTKYGEGYKLQEFTQDKPLYPATGSVTGWGTAMYFDQLSDKASGGQKVLDGLENVVDKVVLVENTGRSDAYTRTWFAFELGSVSYERWDEIIMTNTNSVGEGNDGAYIWTWKGVSEIDGNKYVIAEAVYKGFEGGRHDKGILPAGEYSYNSLAQVYMKSTATNEDVEAIDGNGNGKYDILVLSQAVQTKGFADAQTALDTAFGTEHPWVAKTISTIDWVEVQKATLEKRVIVNLTNALDDEDEYITTSNTNLVINGNNYDITAGTPGNYAGKHDNNSNVTYNNVNIISEGGGVGASGGSKVTFNGNSIHVATTSSSGRYNFYAEDAGSQIIINSGTFSFDTSSSKKRAYIYAQAGTTVYVNGGTFGKASTRDKYNAGIMGEGTVIIKGGTFGFDPSNWVAEGYKAVKDGSNWIVQAK